MTNRFTYYLPGLTGCNNGMLEKRGILSRFAIPGGVQCYGITSWAEGPAGFGVSVALGIERTEYSPALQLWQDCGEFWLGMTKDAAPGPNDLLRMIGFNGFELLLADGNYWRIPRLRKWTEKDFISTLPKSLRPVKRDGRMNVEMIVTPQYESLDRLGEKILTAFLTEQTWSFNDLFATCKLLLEANYIIGDEEIAMLGLLNEENALKMIALAIDVPGIEAHARKVADENIWVDDRSDEAPEVQPVKISPVGEGDNG